MPKAKPYSEPVDHHIAVQVLNATGVKDGAWLLGDALFNAAENLARLVQEGNKALEGNEFANIVAEHLAARLSRRGASHLFVTEVGQVTLIISYEEVQPTPPQRQRTAPLMKELKARAKALGVDISHLGIKRKAIHAFLEGMTATSEKPKTRGKPKTTKPVVLVADEAVDSDPGPMSAGPDETTTSPPPELPPRRPPPTIVKSDPMGESPVVVDASESTNGGSKPSKSQGEGDHRSPLRQLVQDAKDVDIASLLASETPD